MPSRQELVVRGNAVGLVASNYPNDSKFEQKILYLEKRATTFAGTLGSQTITTSGVFSDAETITVGGKIYTMKTTLSEVKASSTLTSDATAPSDGDTVTIDGITYVFRTALTNTSGAPYEVLIGGSAAVALDNLKAAINDSGTEGTHYGLGTDAHPTVTAEANANTTQEVTAKRFGTYANGFITVESSSHLAWDDTTLGGASATPGVNAVENEVLIGASAAASLDNLKSAINDTGTEGTHYSTGTAAHPEVTATTNTDSTQLVEASWGSTTLASGVAKVTALNATTASGSAGLSGDKNV
jgi:hypothetical protein